MGPTGSAFPYPLLLPLTGTVRITRRLVLLVLLVFACQPAGAVPLPQTYSPGAHGSPTVKDPATDPAVRTHVPLGGHPRFEPNLTISPLILSLRVQLQFGSSNTGTTGSPSPRSCTSKPTPTSAPGWTPMTLVGEIFLLFARVRLHPFLEKWILLPHDDMPHTQRRQQPWEGRSTNVLPARSSIRRGRVRARGAGINI